MLTASRLTRQMSLPMAEFVARPEHCHDSQVHDGGASRCCWRVETEPCSMFLNLVAIIGGFAAASL